MHKNSDDRRAKRSRRLLKEGLLSLMQEKRFQDITARDITESADLNRGTFYLHYPDTQALLESIEDDIMAEIQALVDQHLEEFMDSPTLEPVLMPVLDYILEKRTAIELLLYNSAGNFLDKLQTLIYRNSLDYARKRFAIEDPVQLDYFFSFVSFGIIAMVKVWIGQNMNLPKKKLIAYADALMDNAAKADF
ncbi:MAG: TetR/AcrR family transcriptional regulator C-terminal domain-containing protein [Firmicutes bacterium]|nr:TetR/AcrR family transcriptional regulator C-terminal domain-containing protein [Bacillota bacterium]